MNLRFVLACFGACLSVVLLAGSHARAATPSPALVAHGRYLAIIGGCNDCHTAGYASSGGRTPEKKWLEGSALGWHGPWGTTYPPNLRLFMQTMTLKQWIRFARTASLRPPMPVWSLRTMTAHDLAALYAFIRFLGPAGKVAPSYLRPGAMPHGPYVKWVIPPVKKLAAAAHRQ